MTKKEIVKTISEEIGLTQLKTKEIVQKTFDAIVDTLVDDTRNGLQQGENGQLGRIELRNFGVFEVKRRAARKARNPRTGEKVLVDEKFVVTFKPGKEMEERVRRLQDREQSAGKPSAGSPSAKPLDETNNTKNHNTSSHADPSSVPQPGSGTFGTPPTGFSAG